MIDGIIAAHEAIKPIIELQRDLQKKVGRPKQEVKVEDGRDALYERVVEVSLDDWFDALAIPTKTERKAAVSAACASAMETIVGDDEAPSQSVRVKSLYLDRVQRDIVRTQVVESGVRIDGRV